MSRRFFSLWKSRLRLARHESQGASKEKLYEYSPLKASSDKIRLLTLLPGPFGTAIQCKLRTTTLNKDSPPLYEALSYAWGSQEDPVIIYIAKGALPVTQNLAGALQHLRHPDRPRTLWIDAICVNQKDIDERSQQVLRMAEIYTLADCVVVWLGPEADESSRILKIFNTIGSMIDVDWASKSMKPSGKALSSGELHWADQTSMPFAAGELDPAYDLLVRPWFDRLWVQQEITLATKAVLVCGFDSLRWLYFRAAIFYLDAKMINNMHVVNDFDGFRKRMMEVFSLCVQPPGLDLAEQIRRTRHCKCLDPRDRIYALLSISEFPHHVAVDYGKSADEICRDVALQYYESTLELLTVCEMQDQLSNRASWVPDWTGTRGTHSIPPRRTCGNTGQYVKYLGGNVLRVIGKRVTRIKSVESINLSNEWEVDCIAAIRKHAASSCIQSNDGPGLDIYCRTLLFGLLSNSFEPPKLRFLDLEESKGVLRSILDEHWPVPPIAHRQQFVSVAVAAMWGRSFFWTEDGRMGLGPKLATSTDEIVVFPGECRSPMILRPSNDGNGRYRVVGECFIDDLMHGEALLGPAPENYEHFKKLDSTEGYYYEQCIRDINTGDIPDKDPRFDLMYSEMREDGMRRVYPTGRPNVEDKEYTGLRAWTGYRLGEGEEVELMRNDLEPFLLE